MTGATIGTAGLVSPVSGLIVFGQYPLVAKWHVSNSSPSAERVRILQARIKPWRIRFWITVGKAPPSQLASNRTLWKFSQRYSAKVAAKLVLPLPLWPMIKVAVKIRCTGVGAGAGVGVCVCVSSAMLCLLLL